MLLDPNCSPPIAVISDDPSSIEGGPIRIIFVLQRSGGALDPVSIEQFCAAETELTHGTLRKGVGRSFVGVLVDCNSVHHWFGLVDSDFGEYHSVHCGNRCSGPAVRLQDRRLARRVDRGGHRRPCHLLLHAHSRQSIETLISSLFHFPEILSPSGEYFYLVDWLVLC